MPAIDPIADVRKMPSSWPMKREQTDFSRSLEELTGHDARDPEAVLARGEGALGPLRVQPARQYDVHGIDVAIRGNVGEAFVGIPGFRWNAVGVCYPLHLSGFPDTRAATCARSACSNRGII